MEHVAKNGLSFVHKQLPDEIRTAPASLQPMMPSVTPESEKPGDQPKAEPAGDPKSEPKKPS
jgi:hypothetical protein